MDATFGWDFPTSINMMDFVLDGKQNCFDPSNSFDVIQDPFVDELPLNLFDTGSLLGPSSSKFASDDAIIDSLVQDLDALEQQSSSASHSVWLDSDPAPVLDVTKLPITQAPEPVREEIVDLTQAEHSYCNFPDSLITMSHSSRLDTTSPSADSGVSSVSNSGISTGSRWRENAVMNRGARTISSSESSESASVNTFDILETSLILSDIPTCSDYCQANKPGKRKANSPDSMILPFTNQDCSKSTKEHGCSGRRRREGYCSYPLLRLSSEERLVCERESIHLPERYPLTKQEERDLKRIRRKIRNKQSANDSRRKKREYVEALESRVTESSRENKALKQEVEQLRKHNESLMTQLKRLQASMTGTGRRTAQTGTCLAVILLSFALLVAPSYSPFGKNGRGEKHRAASPPRRLPISGHTRSILQAPSSNLGSQADGKGGAFDGSLGGSEGSESPVDAGSEYAASDESPLPSVLGDGPALEMELSSQGHFMDEGNKSRLYLTGFEEKRGKQDFFTSAEDPFLGSGLKRDWPFDDAENEEEMKLAEKRLRKFAEEEFGGLDKNNNSDNHVLVVMHAVQNGIKGEEL